jgi:hypothetical protein
VPHDIEAALGGDFLAAFRDEADGVGPQGEREGGHRRGAGHLEVEPGADLFRAAGQDVALLDVAAVLAQVDGDAVGARRSQRKARATGSGSTVAAHGGAGLPVAGLAEGGAVVDVDAEEDHAARKTKL